MRKGTGPRIPLPPGAVPSTSVNEPKGDLTVLQLSLLSQFSLLLRCRVWVIFMFIEPGSEDALGLLGEPATTTTLFGGIGTWCRERKLCSIVAARHVRERWRVIDAILS